MEPSLHSLLGRIAAVALGLTAFAGGLEPAQKGRQSPDASAIDGVVRRLPERPRAHVDIAAPVQTGRTLRVPAGGDLQGAIDQARAGDVIALEPGATYRGPFGLPRKDGDGWIVIAPRVDKGLPPPGQRADPSHARAMPKIVASSGDAVIETAEGAHHYRIVGLEIAPADGVFLMALVQIGASEPDAGSIPHHIVIDRCYLHGDPRKGTRRGIALNARDSAVVNSYLSDFKEVANDSQAVSGWNAPGPLKIANHDLEAAGENVMFGGADPTIPDLVPSDIEVTGNQLAKPLRWKEGDPTFEGTAWAVKNLFELKNARRVLVDGNLLEYNWPHAQNGFSILFTPRNQDGGAPWSVVEDITFVQNAVRHGTAGINVMGRDDIHKSQPTKRIAILNNAFLDVGGRWGRGRLFQLLDGTEDVTIEHNTASHANGSMWGGDRTPHHGFVFQNNIVFDNDEGIVAEGTAGGRPTLDRYFPGAVVRRNAFVGGSADRYPADNFFPASLKQVGFVGLPTADLHLSATSPFKRAGTDKRDLGADMDSVYQVGPVATSGGR